MTDGIPTTQLLAVEYQHAMTGDMVISILIARRLQDMEVAPGHIFIPEGRDGEQRFRAMALGLESAIPSMKNGNRTMSNLLIEVPENGHERKERLAAINTLLRQAAAATPEVSFLVLGDAGAILEAVAPDRYRQDGEQHDHMEAFRVDLDNETGNVSPPICLGNLKRVPAARR